jgi:hypothetical protein
MKNPTGLSSDRKGEGVFLLGLQFNKSFSLSIPRSLKGVLLDCNGMHQLMWHTRLFT